MDVSSITRSIMFIGMALGLATTRADHGEIGMVFADVAEMVAHRAQIRVAHPRSDGISPVPSPARSARLRCTHDTYPRQR